MSSLSTFLNRNHFSKVFPPKLFALFSAYELLPEPLLCLALTPSSSSSSSSSSSCSSVPDKSALPSGSDFPNSPSSSFSANHLASPQYPSSNATWSPHTPPNHPHQNPFVASTIPPSSLLICANSSAYSLLSEFVPSFSNDYPIPLSQFMTHCTSNFPTLPPSMHETVRCTLHFLFCSKENASKQTWSLDWSARYVGSSFLDDPSLEVSAYLFVTLKVVKKNPDPSSFNDPPSSSPPPTPTSLSSIRRLSFTSFSYFHSNFHIEKLLGRGSYGAVYQCTHRIDGQRYAVKLVPIPSSHSVDSVLREVKTFASVSSHPNILRYFHAWMEQAPFEPFPNASLRRRSMSNVNTPFRASTSFAFDFPKWDAPHSDGKKSLKTGFSSEKETLDLSSSLENDFRFLPDDAHEEDDDTDDAFDDDDVDDDDEEEEEEDFDDDNEFFSDARSHLSLHDQKDGNTVQSRIPACTTPSSTTTSVEEDNVMAEDPTFQHEWTPTASSFSTFISPRPGHRRSRLASCDAVMSLGYQPPPPHSFCSTRAPTTPHHVVPITTSVHGYPSPPLSLFSSSHSHLLLLRRRNSEVSNYLFIQMECPEMTLKSFLKKRTQPLSLFTAVSIWQQIALGLAHLHARGYVHCDLSSSNIFLNTLPSNHPDETVQYQVLLGDFGLSVPIQEPSLPTASCPTSSTTTTCDTSTFLEDDVVTPIYMAPKTDRSSVSPSLDMYAMAILLVELVTFFATGMERASVLMRFKQSLEIPVLPLTDPVLLDLFLRCGAHDPQKRPTAMDIYTACSLFLECARPSLLQKKSKKEKKQVSKVVVVTSLAVAEEQGTRVSRLEKKSKSFSFLRPRSSTTLEEKKIVFEREAEQQVPRADGSEEVALERRSLQTRRSAPRHFAFTLKDAEHFVKKVQMELNHELGLIRSSSSSMKSKKKKKRISA